MLMNVDVVKIKDLYLSLEKQTKANLSFDPSIENTDVIVVLESDEKYIASFFSYKNIEKLKREHQISGEYLAGKFFRVDHMVLVEHCSKDYIQEVVNYLIEEGDFFNTFRKI